MLYTLIFDSNNYLEFYFDEEQIKNILGEMDEDNAEKHINLNNQPYSFKKLFNEPLNFDFCPVGKEDQSSSVPDIAIASGRLFLSQRAYDVLYPLINSDGEFLPVTYQKGNGHFFIPFRVAEDVDAINKELSVENAWNYFDYLVFYEEKVKDWSIFRMKHDGYMSVYCQENIKEAIEQADLKGLYITNDLANIFPEEQSTHSKSN